MHHAFEHAHLCPEVLPQQRLRLQVARVDESRPLGGIGVPGPGDYLVQYLGCQALAAHAGGYSDIGDVVRWMLLRTPNTSDQGDRCCLDHGYQLNAVAFREDGIQPVGVHGPKFAIQERVLVPLLNPGPVIS